jgi:hypothetical protein
MKSGMSLLGDAIDVAIKDVRRASFLAEQVGDRAALRNISDKLPELMEMKKQVEWWNQYFGQPKHKPYFDR